MPRKVSIIMSVYNNEEYLDLAIQSILNQTYKNFEFIITNDFSSDRSQEIINHYTCKDKRIISINNNVNMGLTSSLNNMISMASGDLIARMDGDDVALPNRIEKQVKVFEKNPNIDFVFTDTILIDFLGEEICSSWRPNNLDEILRVIKYVNYIPHPTVMLKKNLFENISYYNPVCRTGQDHELWMKFVEQDVDFYYLKESLLLYRINPNSVRGKSGENKYFRLANICIFNKSKKSSLKYFRYLNFQQKIKIFIKWLIPFRLLYLKGLAQKKRKGMQS